MAEFHGALTGSGAEVTRTGTKKSGIDCTLNSDTLCVMTRIHTSVNHPHGFVHAEFGSETNRSEFGSVYFGKDYGDDKWTFVVTPRFIYNCDRAKLLESIMADDEMVKLLRGAIFIEGKADVD